MDQKVDQSQIDALKTLHDDSKAMENVLGKYQMNFEARKKMHGNLEHMTRSMYLDPADTIRQLAIPVSVAVRNLLKATAFKPFVEYFSECSLYISKKENIYINFGRLINYCMFLGFSVHIEACKDGVTVKKIALQCMYGDQQTDFVKAPCSEQLKQTVYAGKRKFDHCLTDSLVYTGLPARSASVVLESWHPKKRAKQA